MAHPLEARLREWREYRGILRFAWDHFRFNPDAWQERALLAFESPDPRKQRVALQACAGPGKTAVMAIAGWWFLTVQGRQGEHPKGAAVSVTKENLRDNLWAEFAKWHGRSPLLQRLFTWTSNRIFATDHPETWFLSAKSWPKTGTAEEQGKTLSGLHSKYVCALIDESGGIPPTILRAGEQALSSCEWGKLMQAGNPISRDGMLYEACVKLGDQWFVIRITGDPDDPEAWVHSPRLVLEGGRNPALEWAAKQIAQYGRDNPWVKSYILGQFPPASINALMSEDEVLAAFRRNPAPELYVHAQKRVGVDVARYGDDRTVIFPRQGILARRPIIMRHERGASVSVDIATRVLAVSAKFGSEVTLIDATGGWGAGARDVLVNAGHGAIDVQFGSVHCHPKYKNRRAEMWFRMAEWLKKGGALPEIAELLSELVETTYTFDNGKFVIEPKDLIKERLGKSPDIADALATTFAIPDMPALGSQAALVAKMANQAVPSGRQVGRGKAAIDFDPFAVPED